MRMENRTQLASMMAILLSASGALAGLTIDFEALTYSTGTLAGQDGWTAANQNEGLIMDESLYPASHAGSTQYVGGENASGGHVNANVYREFDPTAAFDPSHTKVQMTFYAKGPHVGGPGVYLSGQTKLGVKMSASSDGGWHWFFTAVDANEDETEGDSFTSQDGSETWAIKGIWNQVMFELDLAQTGGAASIYYRIDNDDDGDFTDEAWKGTGLEDVPMNMASTDIMDLDFVRFRMDTMSDHTDWSGFDDLTITSVPEPMTMSLLAVGGLALLRRKR